MKQAEPVHQGSLALLDHQDPQDLQEQTATEVTMAMPGHQAPVAPEDQLAQSANQDSEAAGDNPDKPGNTISWQRGI